MVKLFRQGEISCTAQPELIGICIFSRKLIVGLPDGKIRTSFYNWKIRCAVCGERNLLPVTRTKERIFSGLSRQA
jgi:hypothetical protein